MNRFRIFVRIAFFSTLSSLSAIANAQIPLGINVVERDAGVQVASVNPGRTGAEMGLRNGDVIYQVNGKRIDSIRALHQSLQSNSIKIIWKRNGRFFEARAGWAAAAPAERAPPPAVHVYGIREVTDIFGAGEADETLLVPNNRNGMLGVVGQASRISGIEAVQVTSVVEGSAAKQLQLVNGSPGRFQIVPYRDFITEINGVRVRTFDELRQEISRSPGRCTLKILDSETRSHDEYYAYIK